MKILMISPAAAYAARRLAEEGRKVGVGLAVLDAAEAAALPAETATGFDLLYVRNPYVLGSARCLPDVIALAKRFAASGKPVVDQAVAAGRLGEGKWADYQRLQEAGISIPQTTARPPVAAPRLPYILKWTYGFGGRHTFFISDQKRAATVAARYPAGELLLQEYVPAEFEYKVITIGYRALPVILKFALHPKTRRPDFKRYWVLKENAAVTALAQRAAKELGRELAKTDIMEAAGRLYVLEVNRFPGLHSFEALTGYNVAEKFMDYLLKKGMADNLHNS